MRPREVFPGVTVDSRVAFGSPCIAGSGIRTRVIASRFKSGETALALARDYEVLVPQIEAALRWECLSLRSRKRRLATVLNARRPPKPRRKGR